MSNSEPTSPMEFASLGTLLWRAIGPLPIGILGLGLLLSAQTRPLWSRLDAFRLESHWPLLGAVAMLVGASIFLVQGFRRGWSMHRAASGGVRRKAVIESIEKTSSHKNKRVLWEMRWIDEQGHAGSARPDFEARFTSYEVGDAIELRIDPETQRAFWVMDLAA